MVSVTPEGLLGSEVPEIGPPDEAAIARGKEIYIKQSCHSCHGEDGKGGGTKEQFDDEGYPTRPRDYTRGIFKGGHDPASLYRRVAYGMPGTVMPSNFHEVDGTWKANAVLPEGRLRNPDADHIELLIRYQKFFDSEEAAFLLRRQEAEGDSN